MFLIKQSIRAHNGEKLVNCFAFEASNCYFWYDKNMKHIDDINSLVNWADKN